MAITVAVLTAVIISAAIAGEIDAFSRKGALSRLRQAIDAMSDSMAFFDADDGSWPGTLAMPS
jgi:hypothetical protein